MGLIQFIQLIQTSPGDARDTTGCSWHRPQPVSIFSLLQVTQYSHKTLQRRRCLQRTIQRTYIKCLRVGNTSIMLSHLHEEIWVLITLEILTMQELQQEPFIMKWEAFLYPWSQSYWQGDAFCSLPTHPRRFIRLWIISQSTALTGSKTSWCLINKLIEFHCSSLSINASLLVIDW